LITAVSTVTGVYNPTGMVVDSCGNIYFADSGSNEIKKWTASTQTLCTVVTCQPYLSGLAMDGAGNLLLRVR